MVVVTGTVEKQHLTKFCVLVHHLRGSCHCLIIRPTTAGTQFSCRAPEVGEKTHEIDAGRCVSAFQQKLVSTHLVSTEAFLRAAENTYGRFWLDQELRATLADILSLVDSRRVRARLPSFAPSLPPSLFLRQTLSFPHKVTTAIEKKNYRSSFFPLQSQNGE